MAITPVQGKQIATASWAINAISSSYSATAVYATTAGTATTATNISGFAAATVYQINTGETSTGTYNYIVRTQELEQSKYSTINIYNNLNFT